MSVADPEVKRRTDRIPLSTVRQQLGILWFVGCGVIAATLIAQTITGHYGDQQNVKKVWDWFVPLVSPTLLTMLGVLAGSAVGKPEDHDVNRAFYHLVCGISFFYLIVIAAPIFAQGIWPDRWAQMLDSSNYWLDAIKGLAVAAISALFSSKKQTDDA